MPSNVFWRYALPISVVMVVLGLIPAVELYLRYDRSLLVIEFWRIFTAHYVHLNLSHALLNVAGLLLLVYFFGNDISRSDFICIVLAGPLFISLGLWFSAPTMQAYVGFSGVLHALLYYVAIVLIFTVPRFGVIMLLLLLSQQIWEQTPWYDANYLRNMIAGSVMPYAHLWGGVLGALVALYRYRKSLSHRFSF